MDGLFLIPMAFIAFAYPTNWTLWVCALVAAGLWATIAAVRRFRAQHRAS